jgi:hypothetical protein
MFQKLPDTVASLAENMATEKPEIETSGLFTSAAPEPEPEPEPKTAAEVETPEPEEDLFDAETWASTAVDALEGLNEKVLVRIYESQQLKNVNPQTLESVLYKLTLVEHKKPVTIEPEDRAVIKIIGKVNDYKKKTVFTPEKREKLEKATARYLQSLNIKNDLPPGKALLLAVAIAEAPLILPLVEHYADAYLNKTKAPATTPAPPPPAPTMVAHVTREENPKPEKPKKNISGLKVKNPAEKS